MSYTQFNVTVSDSQKDKLRNAIKNKKAVNLRL